MEDNFNRTQPQWKNLLAKLELSLKKDKSHKMEKIFAMISKLWYFEDSEEGRLRNNYSHKNVAYKLCPDVHKVCSIL